MFHKVPEGKTVKNRVRFDLQAADIAAEADRLTGFGAQQIRSLLAKAIQDCLPARARRVPDGSGE
jgi:Glyoxalase-like domain